LTSMKNESHFMLEKIFPIRDDVHEDLDTQKRNELAKVFLSVCDLGH
jgi:hypothetical protein